MYGAMIQKLRKDHKYSQKELGTFLGIGVSTISMWEAEKREPDLTHLTAIAELFHVSVDYILTGAVDDIRLSQMEQEVLELFRELPKEQQYEIKGIIRGYMLHGGLGNGDWNK